MKKISRKVTSIIMKAMVILLAILCVVLLAAAIVTVSKILFTLFCICGTVYTVVFVTKKIILPKFKKK